MHSSSPYRIHTFIHTNIQLKSCFFTFCFVIIACHIQASKKGLGYSNQMFITQNWYESGWWAKSDCSEQVMVHLINNTLAVALEPPNEEDSRIKLEVHWCNICVLQHVIWISSLLPYMHLLLLWHTVSFAIFTLYIWCCVCSSSCH